MSYKLITVDLDGTLLNDQGAVPDENKKAVRHLQDKGVRVVCCSGRSKHSIQYFAKEMGLNKPGDYGIAVNGGYIYEADTLRALAEYRLALDTAKKVMDIAGEFGLNYKAYMDGVQLGTAEIDYMKTYFHYNHMEYDPQTAPQLSTGDVSKVLLMGEYEMLNRLKEYAEERLSHLCNIFFSSRNYLEFTHLNATKGNGLAYLANLLNINIEETLAIGDSFNDVTMVKKAGLGIAMRNGEKAVQDSAKYVSKRNNNQGVLMEVLERFF